MRRRWLPFLLAGLLGGFGCASDAQTLYSFGQCSPPVNNSWNVTITCPTDTTELNKQLTKIMSLFVNENEGFAYITHLYQSNQKELVTDLSFLLAASETTLRQLRRQEFPLTKDVRLSAMVFIPSRGNVLENISKRMDKQFPAGPEPEAYNHNWPSVFEKNLEWLKAEDDVFPKVSDGKSFDFAVGTTLELRCFTASEGDEEKWKSIKTFDDLQQVKELPFRRQRVILDPRTCGTGLALRSWQSNEMIVYGVDVPPVDGSVSYDASVTSILDILGGVCFVGVTSTGNFTPDDVGDAIKDSYLYSAAMTLSPGMRWNFSQMMNGISVSADRRMHLYKWMLPRKLSDLNQLPSDPFISPLSCK